MLLGGAVLAVLTANPASSSAGYPMAQQPRRVQARPLDGLLEIRHLAAVSIPSVTLPPPPTTVATTSTTVVTTTTTAPTTTTQAPVPPETAPASADAVHDAIRRWFPEVYDAAVRVASCESGLNPRAVSPGGGNFGLFQINKVHRGRVASMGYSWDQIYDPYVNSEVARSVYNDAGGWGPWTCQP